MKSFKDYNTQDIEFKSTAALKLANTNITKKIIDLRIKSGGGQPELRRHLEACNETCRRDDRGSKDAS